MINVFIGAAIGIMILLFGAIVWVAIEIHHRYRGGK